MRSEFLRSAPVRSAWEKSAFLMRAPCAIVWARLESVKLESLRLMPLSSDLKRLTRLAETPVRLASTSVDCSSVASSSVASMKVLLVRSDLKRCAVSRLASSKFALRSVYMARFAPWRFAPWRFAPTRLDWKRSAFSQFASGTIAQSSMTSVPPALM